MTVNIKTIATILTAGLSLCSCSDYSDLESEISGLEYRVTAIEKQVGEINANAIAAKKLFDENNLIIGVNEREDGTGYDIEFSDGSYASIYVADDSRPGGGISPVIGIDADGNWTVQIGDREPEIIEDAPNAFGDDAIAPKVRVNEDGYWEISTDGGITYELITYGNGKPVYADASVLTSSFFTSVTYDAQSDRLTLVLSSGDEVTLAVYDILTIEFEGYEEGQSIFLSQELALNVTLSPDVTKAYFSEYPEGWRARLEETAGGNGKHVLTVMAPETGTAGKYTVILRLESKEAYVRNCVLTFSLVDTQWDPSACAEWNEFVSGADNNVLLDFSYAGYMHGEKAPDEIAMNLESGTAIVNGETYRIYDVTDYGAIPDDGKSDRDAFLKVLTEISGGAGTADKPNPVLNTKGDQLTFNHKNKANAVVYFPEGNFILHTEEDNIENPSAPEGYVTPSIIIRCGNFVLKGAGRDKTTITMADMGMPSTTDMYSSPDMLQLKHNTGIQYNNILATVTGDTPKGGFSVEVNSTAELKAGDWVCLYLHNRELELVEKELAPYPVNPSSNWVIVGYGKEDNKNSGVVVKDLHQIKSVSGNRVTFHEPVMHEVEAKWDWKIVSYQHYETVGVEDITFAGNAKEDFDHHASWMDDGAYKPISMTRLVNSWMRRVDFTSVSEACSVIESANVSVYDCEISGARGHSAIRSQASSRVFIGAVRDRAHGRSMDELGHNVTGSDPNEITGQYHAVGVSKESMGAVLWRNTWGSDACFEAHATQPRATLIDCCKGSFRRWRQGGDEIQMPNHLSDLTIWNFNNTTAFSGEWIWWDKGSQWWKFMPPVVVGFHGEPVMFNEEQTLRISGEGMPVAPESLYEAQLKKRLGAVPGWLQSLKAVAQ